MTDFKISEKIDTSDWDSLPEETKRQLAGTIENFLTDKIKTWQGQFIPPIEVTDYTVSKDSKGLLGKGEV